MNSWTDCLINAETLSALYDGQPPLKDFELLDLRLDQRGPSCFVRGVMSRFPDHPRSGWPADADRLQIRLNLTSVEGFRASGEGTGGTVDLTIERADDGFGVAVRGEGDDFEFATHGIGLQLIGMKPIPNNQ